MGRRACWERAVGGRGGKGGGGKEPCSLSNGNRGAEAPVVGSETSWRRDAWPATVAHARWWWFEVWDCCHTERPRSRVGFPAIRFSAFLHRLPHPLWSRSELCRAAGRWRRGRVRMGKHGPDRPEIPQFSILLSRESGKTFRKTDPESFTHTASTRTQQEEPLSRTLI